MISSNTSWSLLGVVFAATVVAVVVGVSSCRSTLSWCWNWLSVGSDCVVTISGTVGVWWLSSGWWFRSGCSMGASIVADGVATTSVASSRSSGRTYAKDVYVNSLASDDSVCGGCSSVFVSSTAVVVGVTVSVSFIFSFVFRSTSFRLIVLKRFKIC